MKPPNSLQLPELTSWLQNILDNCSDPALIADPAFRIVKWNTALEALLPGKNDCLADCHVLNILEQLECETGDLTQKLSELSNGVQLEEYILLRRADGTRLGLSVYLHKLPDTHTVSAIVVTIHELRTQIEQQQTPEAFYKALMDTISEGALLLKGEKGAVVAGNERAWQILSTREETMLGRDLLSMHWEVTRANGSLISPGQYPVAVTLRTGKPVKNEVLGLKAPSGKMTWLSVNCTPVKGLDNAQHGYAVVAFQDITHEIEAQDKAQQNDSLFYAYLNKSLSCTWISNEDGQMVFINDLAREMLKVQDNYQLKHIDELFAKDAAAFFLDTDRQVLESKEPLIFTTPWPRQDGSMGFYMVHKFLLQHPCSKLLVAGQAIDITDEKNGQENLRKGNERFSLIIKAISECVWDWDMETGQILPQRIISCPDRLQYG